MISVRPVGGGAPAGRRSECLGEPRWDSGALKQLLQQATQSTPSPGSTSQGSTPPTGGGGTRFGNTLADGDLVWVFSSDYTVADIFRVVDGKIIEHWDIAADAQ